MQGKALARGRDCSEPTGVLYQKLKPGPGKDAAQVASHQRARIHSAMLDLVAENGYDAVTVRDLSQAAGVSTRSFYKHYSSKEQCFLRILQLATQRVLRLIDFPRGRTIGEGVRPSIEPIVDALTSEPKAARLICVDAYAAGPVAFKHAESGRRSIEMAIDERLGEEPDTSGSSFGAEAIVAGAYSAIRGNSLEEQKDPPPRKVSDRDRNVGDVEASKGDRTALLKAAVKLATAESYRTLTLSKLIKAAGVSRRTFDANFSSLDECLLRALELRAVEPMARVREAGESGLDPEESAYRVVATLCRRIEHDKSFAALCFDATVAPGIPRMCLQQALIDELALTVADRLETAQRVDRPGVRVAVGSIWGVIQNQVTSGEAHGLLRRAPALTCLLLAPMIEPPSAMGRLSGARMNDLMSVCRDSKAVLDLQ
jgi:AcrR family transcriptional regulator